MKISTRTLALFAPFIPVILLAQPGHFQRSTFFEQPNTLSKFREPLETADGGIFATLVTDTSRCLIKLDMNGDPVNAFSYPSSLTDAYWYITAMSATSDGGAVMVTDIDQVGFSHDTCDVVVVRVDAMGLVLWARHIVYTVSPFGGSSSEARIITHGNGEHSIAVWQGSFSDGVALFRINDSGDLLWSRSVPTYPWPNMTLALGSAADHSITMMAEATPSSYRTDLHRFDMTGNELFGTRVELTNANWAHYGAALLVTDPGTIYVRGLNETSQTEFPFLFSMNNTGTLDWYKHYGDGNAGPYFAVEPYGHGKVLPNGDLQFGGNARNYFTPTGDHLGGAHRAWPMVQDAVNSYQLQGTLEPSSTSDAIFTGHYRKTDLTFSYMWQTPTIERIPWDLLATCGWEGDTLYALTDTVVPAAFVEVTTLPSSQPLIAIASDTTVIAVPEPFGTFFDFCTLVGVEETTANGQPALEVFPSFVTAGASINLRSTEAAEVTVLDARGRIVWRDRLSAGLTDMPTNALAPGLHLVQAVDRQGRALGSARFVVE